jgi:outer membrane lipoprotein-sorting protein
MSIFITIFVSAFLGFLNQPLVAQEEVPLGELKTIEVPKQKSFIDKREMLIENYLNGLNSLKAKFVQRGPNGDISKGVFSLEKPGKARFEYDGDQSFLIVSDGETLNLIDYEVGQVTKWPVNDTPLALLLGENIIFGQNFVLQSVGAGNLANIIEVRAHDPKKPEQGTLTLYFSLDDNGDEANLTLLAWQIIDAKGELTSVTLTQVQENLSLAAGLWEFKDPRADKLKRRSRR